MTRAACHVALKQPREARRDYEAVLAVDSRGKAGDAAQEPLEAKAKATAAPRGNVAVSLAVPAVLAPAALPAFILTEVCAMPGILALCYLITLPFKNSDEVRATPPASSRWLKAPHMVASRPCFSMRSRRSGSRNWAA